MDPALMAALQGAGGPPGMPPGGPSPMDPNAPPGPGGAAMPMMAPPPGPTGQTPADITMLMSMQMAPQQAADMQQFVQGQKDQTMSALAAALSQIGNPLGAAAASQGALPPAPDALDAAGPTDPSLDPNAMAMSGG